MFKKKKQTPQKKKSVLRKKCVTKAKYLVRKNANFKCEKCGRGEPNNQTPGSHVLPEGLFVGMSADIDNICCLCCGCHMWGNDSWHKNPIAAAEWFNKTYPGRYEILKERAKDTAPKDISFWEAKLEELKSLESR